ncbi:hypothetical protein [Kitasatospora sp. NPDC087315]|uniref:hypothetical protein n=1 Tax=Kitasatospora sp. NPDC087315 TaxID=3364069 RepID=UPI0037F8FDE3
MLTLPRTRPQLPAGWPQPRYREYHRAINVARIMDFLLAEQIVHSAEQATDQLITDAARAIAAGHDDPSPETCQAVRNAIAAIITTPLPPLSNDDAMDQLHALLDGTEWTANGWEEVARIIRATGRTITDPST